MSEYNSIEVPIIPDSPKTLPNEILYVYVPKASYDSYGSVKLSKDDFLITKDGFLKLRTDLKIPIYTSDNLPEEFPPVYAVFDYTENGEHKLAIYSQGEILGGFTNDGSFVIQGNITSNVGFKIQSGDTDVLLDFEDFNKVKNLDEKYMAKPKSYTYSIVPCIKPDGSQDRYVISSVPMGGAIPLYSNGGVLQVIDPISDKDCVNKQYAEAKFLGIPDSSKGNAIPYVEYITGEQKFYYASASAYRGYLAVCASNSKGDGVLNTNTPENDLHAANKKYVDDAVSSLGWKCIAENVSVYPSTFSIPTIAEGKLLMFVIREPDGIKTAYIESGHGSDYNVFSSPFKMYNRSGLAYIRGYDGDYELLDAITDESMVVYDDMYISAYII